MHAVDKICDIYCGHGFASSVRATEYRDGMGKTFAHMRSLDRSFITLKAAFAGH